MNFRQTVTVGLIGVASMFSSCARHSNVVEKAAQTVEHTTAKAGTDALKVMGQDAKNVYIPRFKSPQDSAAFVKDSTTAEKKFAAVDESACRKKEKLINIEDEKYRKAYNKIQKEIDKSTSDEKTYKLVDKQDKLTDKYDTKMDKLDHNYDTETYKAWNTRADKFRNLMKTHYSPEYRKQLKVNIDKFNKDLCNHSNEFKALDDRSNILKLSHEESDGTLNLPKL